MLSSWLAHALLAAAALPPAAAQDPKALEPETLERLITTLSSTIAERYVFPDVAQALAEHLKERLWAGAYEGLGVETLAGRLTNDLRSVNNDRHLHVWPLDARAGAEAEPDPEASRREQREEARRSNYGFRKVEILEGNIGYLELNGFVTTELAGDTATGAMAFLANVDALIIDLRANGGGEPSMIQLLCSYFFAEPTLLNTFQCRGKEEIEEYWTLPQVPGKKLLETPLYVLTSGNTFSAAEEFTYDLKCLKRATIVGATTGGGAHPGDTHRIEDLVAVFIPAGRAINPITGTNWEGTGVAPDLAVAAEQTLDAALREARKAAEARRSASGAR